MPSPRNRITFFARPCHRAVARRVRGAGADTTRPRFRHRDARSAGRRWRAAALRARGCGCACAGALAQAVSERRRRRGDRHAHGASDGGGIGPDAYGTPVFRPCSRGRDGRSAMVGVRLRAWMVRWHWLQAGCGFLSGSACSAGFVLGALAGWLLGPAARDLVRAAGRRLRQPDQDDRDPAGVLRGDQRGRRAARAEIDRRARAGARSRGSRSPRCSRSRVGLAVGWIVKPGVGVGALRDRLGLHAEGRARPARRAAQHRAAESVPRAVRRRPRARPPTARTSSCRATATILQVIFFAGLIGFAFVKLGEKAANLRTLAREASETMIQVTRFVLEFTPLGTFGLIAGLVGALRLREAAAAGQFRHRVVHRLRICTSSSCTAACCWRTGSIR